MITPNGKEREVKTMNDNQGAEKPPIPRLGYAISEAAKSIGCSPGHIRNLIERGDLRSAKIGRRRIIRDEDLRALLARDTESQAGGSKKKVT